MFQGVIVAASIVLASLMVLPIPFVHFIIPPLGPFVAGVVGGGVAKANQGRIITFGLYVAALMSIPAVLLVVLGLVLDLDSTIKWLLIIVGFGIVPYTWWAVTMGALISYLIRRGDTEAK
jgi:hypothetical protein